MTTHTSKNIAELVDLYIDKLCGIFGENNAYPTECWQWIGSLDSDGYGQLTYRHKHYRAHRFFFEYFTNTSLGTNHLDHLCRNRACINPNHLEPVTLQENLRRGLRYNKTHCINGHEFTVENTYRTKTNCRQCRMCKAENYKRYIEKRNASLKKYISE
jgi:hypothetical protein